MDRFIVVSSDCHAGLLPDDYREYVDPEHREMFDLALPIQKEAMNKAEEMFLIKEINDEWRKDIEQELKGAWDPAERTKMLDRDGIAAEIVFVDGVTEQNTPPFGAGLGLPTEDMVPELQWAGARAHNRWLADLCSNAPHRHIGVASIPLLWDIDLAVKEVLWCVQNGIKSVLIPHMIGGFEAYHHKKYHPFWEVCQEHNVVIHFHSGASPHKEYFGKGFPNEKDDGYVGAMGAFVTEVYWWTWRPLTFMIWGGVFETFPKLKVSVVETGVGWMLPPYLQLIDHHYTNAEFAAKLGDFTSHLSKLPSEYFSDNVAIGASCVTRGEVEIRHEMGLRQIMWGSDYPHPEGTWPHTRDKLLESFKGFPETEIADMLGENAIRFYDLDRDSLANIAKDIGPKKSDFAA